MSYVIQNVNGCTKKLSFNFETVDLSKQIDVALKEKQKSSNLKGFRQGKAPIDMIKKLYGPQIENEAFYKFVSEQFYGAIQKEKINAVGYPKFENTNYEKEQKKIGFDAVVEVLPEFELKDYKGYSFKKGDESVNKTDLENMKTRMLASKSEMIEVKDESKKLEKGLVAVMNFEGEKADGEKPENMKATDFVLEIGSGQLIPGFEDGMIGMKKGDKKTIELTFPQDYHETSLQNAKVKFHVELLEIKEKKVPDFNDEIAKEYGYESLADFEEKTMAHLTSQKKREVATKLHQDILEKLVAENSFDVPSTLIEQQKKSIHEEVSTNLKQQGFNQDMIHAYFEKWADDVSKKADFQVKSGLILDKIAKKFDIIATEADLDKKIDEMVVQSGIDRAQIESYYKQNQNVKTNLLYAIREEKTFAKLISEMKVS